MPYLIISAEGPHDGPTYVGDESIERSDREGWLIAYLEARKMKGNNFARYKTDHPPRVVLDNLERLGYRVVSMGVGHTCIWTLHKEVDNKSEEEVRN